MHLDLQVQAAVVGGDNAVAEPGGDREGGFRDAFGQKPTRPDGATGFFVVGDVKLDRTTLGLSRRLQRQDGKGVGGDVGFRHRDAAAVHPAIDNGSTVGILGPAIARGDDVAVGVERHRRPAFPVAATDDEVHGRHHAVLADELGRYRVALDGEPEPLQQRGRPLGVGRAIAGRVVGRRADELGQERELPFPVFPHPALQLGPMPGTLRHPLLPTTVDEQGMTEIAGGGQLCLG